MSKDNFTVYKKDSTFIVDDEKTTISDGIVRIIFGDKCVLKTLDTQYDNPISLEDCYDIVYYRSDGCFKGVIIVLFEDKTQGAVYKYGNHGDYWEKTGNTCGYA